MIEPVPEERRAAGPEGPAERVEDAAATVLIPAYNEAGSIRQVVEGLAAADLGCRVEVLVIDDGSTDGTGEAAREAGARVIRTERNRGYGASLKTGILAASTEFVLTMDADGQHRPEDVRRLLALAPACDMAVGQRTRLLHSPLWRMPGKWLLTRMASYLVGRAIPDLNSGLRVLRRDLARKYLHICPSGFSFSTTLTMTLLVRKYHVVFEPIEVQKRQGSSSVRLSTGLETIVLVLRLASLFNPLRLFLPGSFAVGSIGVLWGIPYALAGRGVSVGSMLAIVVAVLLFALGLICDQISQARLERFE